MLETPREYKKRIDEKWKRNEKNKERLIKKIEGYELLDEKFKTKTKQEILANFEKNQKAEQESEQYTIIEGELGKIDQKYEELKQMKEKLKSKKAERDEIENKIRETNVDGADETTLKIQIAEIRKLKEQLETLSSEIEELEKDSNDRELEIKEIEDAYGKIQQTDVPKDREPSDDEIFRKLNRKYSKYTIADSEDDKRQTGVETKKSKTLKEYRDQTIQDLWNKYRVRGQIFKILEAGTGIDDELKERVKKEISDKFFKYYDKKQGKLKMKSARFLKNKIRKYVKEYRKGQGSEREEILKQLKKVEKAYSGDEIKDIGGKQCFKMRSIDGDYIVYRGNETCGGRSKKIGEIKEIGGKPCFKAKKHDGTYAVYRGTGRCGGRSKEEIGEIKEIGGKPCFKAKKNDGTYAVYRGDSECYGCHGVYIDKYVTIHDIHEKNGKPIFFAEDKRGYYSIVIGYDKYTGHCESGYYNNDEYKFEEDIRKKAYMWGNDVIVKWDRD